MKKYLFTIMLLIFPLIVVAEASKPDIVTFGVYPVSIYDVDPANGSFSISFYAWWRSKNKKYAPDKSIEIVNARDYTYKFGYTGPTGKEFYTFVHYYAKIHQVWNSKYFPFGRQYLTVKMEDFSDINSVIFEPDYKESRLHSEFTLPGWEIVSLILKKSVTDYATNFGDARAPRSLYSRLSFIVEVKRNGWRLYMSYFIGFFMAGILVHVMFWMSSIPYPARATIFIGSVIAFIGNKYLVDQRLPPTSVFSLADAIEIATFLVILISIIISISLELTIQDTKRKAKICVSLGMVSLICYATYIIYYTYLAVMS